MWHVSSRSGVATLRTAIHMLLTYLLTYTDKGDIRTFTPTEAGRPTRFSDPGGMQG